MYSKLFLGLLILFVISFITADMVGVLVDFPDGSIHAECLEVNNGINGYDLLQELSINILWAGPGSFGHQLCRANGIGDDVSGDFCSYSGKYWRFFTEKDNSWEYMPVGFDGGDDCWNEDFISFNGHYCVEDKDLISLSYGEWGDSLPDFYTFDQICNAINLKEIRIYVDGKKQRDVDEEGGDIKVKPDSEIEFKINIENNYLFNDDLEIEDIEVEITIKDIDEGSNLDEKVNFKDLEINEDDEDKISFTIPLILEDENYEVELKITGETSTGLKQELIIYYDLEIDKEKHDLIFSKTELQELESCPNENNKLFLEITNIGEKDEEDILFSVKNQDLELDFSETFDLKEGEDDSVYKKELGFIVPELNPGDYRINLNLDYSENLEDSITLTIKDCNQISSGDVTPSNIQYLGSNVKKTVVSNTNYSEKSFFQKYSIPIVLGIFLVFLIGTIFYVVSSLKGNISE